ncbi:hypothetical protein CLAFUW4_11035 [Fulvia fulva]|uniref:Uncharacterized protein n=1 Tax=Passalora fulva TaxID=5499 RepID=A0A9Q8US35_PASFU|nr:uncharacterized protein CLAFUR5_10077 [Fulvia fulva]KAK4620217.1 hypothetical protein CLAFUR4_11040 [Fulvia fulva]KAK4621127.1 hypothetical protein CLAFUR0_11046 [Fulvia fulva]UJO20352.1 hypothetical protein CLAFUR5_10077 [Fulvia fulva]WPV17102.1 hypothetical protein CLAFUW4_11035 [Fulvia fulva]WPV31888.1 hypothetical protein CLAFUW7_11032 [Fulvia fulva]
MGQRSVSKMTACEQALSLPELVEKILDPEYKPAGFLEPPPEIRVLDYTPEQLRNAMHPFRIESVSTGPDGSKLLILSLDMDRDYYLDVRHRNPTGWFLEDLAYQVNASWQEVLICPGQLQIQVSTVMAPRLTWHYPPGQDVTLGQVVRGAVLKLRAGSAGFRRW